MAQYLSRAVFLLSLAFIQSCGGSGGSSSSPAGILFYDLSEDPSGKGYIIENAISPGGQPYTPAPPEISTNGTYPAVFVVDSAASLAFALNSNSSSSSSFHNGSIESYNTSTAQTTSGIQPIANTQTATNPTDMALDPGGNYLVVADHGNGTSTNLSGEVQIFKIESEGALSSPTIPSGLTNSSCPNPDKIVFPPSGSNGTTTDTFYVVCSSPELINSSPPTPALYSCTISGSCTSIQLSELSGSHNAISNMEFASNGTAFLVGETYSSSSSSYNGFFLTCQGTPLSSCNSPASITPPAENAPAGNFAIDNGPTTTAFIGNYSTTSSNSSFNNPGIFFSCTSTSSSCLHSTYNNNSAGASTYLATGPGQNYLYIVSTTQPLPTITTNNTSISSNPGSIFICALPAASSCSPAGTTGSYPYAITFDPSGKFAFVPTWSGTISIFQVASNGTLTADATIPTTTNSSNNLNLQIVVP